MRVPGLIDGRGRTFFFGAIEWLYDRFPEPGPQTVPTVAMRNGDFSSLLAQGITIYDPATAQLVNGRVVRTPFPGNIIPANRISPIAQNVLRFYPEPNQPGDASGRDNYFTVNPRSDDFYSISTRVDHRLTDRQQLFVRYTRNDRRESRNALFGEVGGVVPTGNFLFRKNDGITADHVYTISNQSLLNIRGGWQQFREPNVRQHEGVFDPAALGFGPATLSQFGGAQYFPHFDFDTLTDIGDNLAGNTTHSIYSLQSTLTRMLGKHSVKAGYDVRLYREFGANPGRQAGDYLIRNNASFTRAQDNSTSQNWQDVSSFLVGLPTSGSIEVNGTRLNRTWYHGVYVQDDWRLSNRLTLNLGLRYEYEGATTDSANRNVRGFDPNATLSITNPVEAAYAGAPIPQVPPSAFRVRGGLQFADDAHPGFWDADGNNIQPRAGFAWQLNPATVVRGGVGIYTVPFIIAGTFQPGFSQSTSLVPTLDRGLTFQASLAQPVPRWRAGCPPAAAAGPDTFARPGYQPLRAARFQQRAEHAFHAQRPARAARPVAARGRVRREPRVGSTSGGGGQAGEIDFNAVPDQYLSTSRDPRSARPSIFSPSWSRTHSPGCCPGLPFNGATIAALAALTAVSAVRQRPQASTMTARAGITRRR